MPERGGAVTQEQGFKQTLAQGVGPLTLVHQREAGLGLKRDGRERLVLPVILGYREVRQTLIGAGATFEV